MTPHCHRCGADVGSDASFCATCGAPQLRLGSDHETGPPAEADAAGGGRNPVRSGELRSVDWKKAFRIASLVALPVGLLASLPVLSLGLLFWVAGGAAFAITLYRKRRPGAMLDGGSGFRIGALTGLLAAYISAALDAALQLLARYRFHLGTTMDNEYAQAQERLTLWTYQMVQSSAESEAQMRASLHFLLSPDGRAASSLGGAATKAAFMILLAGIGGVGGVRFFRRRTA